MSRNPDAYTYEILTTEIDRKARTIEMTGDWSVEPVTFKFEINHRLDDDPPVVGQLFEAFLTDLVTEGGAVASFKTAEESFGYLRRFAHNLIEGGILDAKDKAFTAKAVRQHLPESGKKNYALLRTAAVTVEATKRFDRLIVGEEIRSTPVFRTTHEGVTPYEPGEAEAVIAAARHITTNKAEQWEADLAGLARHGGFEVGGRQWITISAEQVIKASKKRSPQAVKRQLPTTKEELEDWSDEEIFDHLVVNGPAPIKGNRAYLPNRLRLVAARLYPDQTEHSAWAVQNCVADLRGLNLSVMTGVSADDVESFGDDGAVVAFAKARNRRSARIPVIAQGFNSLGGLYLLILARTALQRHHLGKDGNRAGQMLYLDASTGAVFNGNVDGTRPAWRSALGEVAPNSSVNRVSFRALRLWALESGLMNDPFHDVEFHNGRTRIDYLRNLVNDATLQEAVSNAVAEATAKASEAVMSESLVRLKTALDDDTAVDLAHTVCSSGQTLPDEPDTPCAQGPLACFGCKCGYRGADQLPGLVSLQVLAERLLKDRPHDVEAALLKEVTRLTLNEFPPAQVQRVKETLDPAVSSLVWHLYAAHRRSTSNG